MELSDLTDEELIVAMPAGVLPPASLPAHLRKFESEVHKRRARVEKLAAALGGGEVVKLAFLMPAQEPGGVGAAYFDDRTVPGFT